ncbi:hypothetical protein EYF80_012281 [Liparis tanakae]|uniref:Uncharacterized protein n=1 Tax=Liparis tanakae TaxID=230148 RepID=A0A4Z2II67_9TELE|nr:hypothetical protein EYF80_012281 [Liparis tanakae]
MSYCFPDVCISEKRLNDQKCGQYPCRLAPCCASGERCTQPTDCRAVSWMPNLTSHAKRKETPPVFKVDALHLPISGPVVRVISRMSVNTPEHDSLTVICGPSNVCAEQLCGVRMH